MKILVNIALPDGSTAVVTIEVDFCATSKLVCLVSIYRQFWWSCV